VGGALNFRRKKDSQSLQKYPMKTNQTKKYILGLYIIFSLDIIQALLILSFTPQICGHFIMQQEIHV